MDVVLVGFIGGFIFGGWRSGFLKRLIGIAFMAAAFVLGAWFRYPVGAFAATFFKDIPADYANLVGYTIAFPVILGALHLAGHFTLGRVQVRGVTKEMDAALGAIFGGVEAVLILSAAIVILDAYFGTSSSIAKDFAPGALQDLTQALNASTTVQLLRDSSVPLVLAVIHPFLPTDLTTLLTSGLPNRLPFPVPIPVPLPTG
ncbi:MAG TPA: CvpA family protein [Candidatus Limnocylindrales bacterium]|nr:CvpA family protein [Candidatus Limnocylindrales bacterium]